MVYYSNPFMSTEFCLLNTTTMMEVGMMPMSLALAASHVFTVLALMLHYVHILS